MNSEKINFIYIGTVLFLWGCYGSLEWWELREYRYWLLWLSVLNLVGLKLKVLHNFWKQCLCITFLLLGMWAWSNAPINPAQELASYFQKQVLAYGSIVPESVKRYPYGTAFTLRCEQLKITSTNQNLRQGFTTEKSVPNVKEVFQITDYSQNLRVFTKNKELSLMGKVWCQGELLPLNTLRNPGGFDGERWNYLQGLGGRLRKTKVVVASTEGSWQDELAVFNLRLREKIINYLPDERGALLCGMLLGGSAGLPDEAREAFAANGLAHLLSVSGTHFALLAGFLLLLLRPLPVKLRKICVLLLLCGYAVLCGVKPPIMRALCMSSVLLLGGSGSARGNLLCLTCLMLLCFRPAWLLDVGFQLSFGAVAGLIWLYPKLKNYFCAYSPTLLGEAMALTTAAQLAVLPLLVAYFNQVPLLSLVSNILLVPVLELATLLTMLGVVLDCAVPCGETLVTWAGWLVRQVLVQAKLLAGLPFSTVTIGSLPLWSAVLYYFGLLIWADVPCLQFLQNRERRGMLTLTGALLFGLFLWKQFVPVNFTAYFLDVGQGDCAVVLTPSRKVIVVDAGGLKNFDTGSRVLVPFLRSLGKSKVDALLLSHGDQDHAGGAAALARSVAIARIVLPATNTLSEAEEALLRNAGGSLVERARAGVRYDFEGTVLEIVDVPRLENVHEPEGNEASTVASIKCGEHSLLFTGDIDRGREKFLPSLEAYDVLKVAHHGSKHSSSLKFLEQVRPKVAVISVGANNGYGHPHAETLQRLASVGSKVLRTDELGAIKVTFDDAGIKCYSYVYNKKNF